MIDKVELTRVLIEVSRFFHSNLPLPVSKAQRAARPKRIQAWQTLTVVSILECSHALLCQVVTTPEGEPYADSQYREFIKWCIEDLERQTPVALQFIQHIHYYLELRGLLKPAYLSTGVKTDG